MDDEHGILKQSRVESDALRLTKEALATIISWPAEGAKFTRKLSGLRFQVKWFQQQVERLFSIEEHDGYMNWVTEICPQLADRIGQLEHEHAKIRSMLSEITPHLERLLPDDWRGLEILCDDLKAVIELIENHTDKETKLLQEAVSQDLGGEGGR